MKTVSIVLLTLATLASGCASMGTRRPSGGGGQITKTGSGDVATPTATDHDTTFDGRIDLGQR
jgi:uncharacterized protein YceK